MINPAVIFGADNYAQVLPKTGIRLANGKTVRFGDEATYDRMFFVSKNGNDTDHVGQSEEQSFLTINKAISEAAAGDCIVVADNGVYTENLVLPNYVTLKAPEATLEGTIVANNGCDVFIGSHHPTANNQTLLLNQGGAKHSFYRFITSDCKNFKGIVNIKNQTNNAILFVEGEILFAGERGVQDVAGGVGSGGHIHFNIKDVYQKGTDNNARLIDSGSGNSDIIGYADHLLVIGAPTNPRAVVASGGGVVRLTCNEIRYGGYTAVTVGDGSEVWLNCLDVKGGVDTSTTGELRASANQRDTQGVVVHGSDENATRIKHEIVTWIGSVEPLNAELHDLWIDTSEE